MLCTEYKIVETSLSSCIKYIQIIHIEFVQMYYVITKALPF